MKTANISPVGLLLIQACLMIWAGVAASAGTFNAGTPAEVQSALDAASANGEDDVIHISAATLSLSSALTYLSGEDQSLALIGAGMTQTVLDCGISCRALSLESTSPMGAVTVRDLTIINGATTGSGGGMVVSSDGAAIRITRCRVQGCAATGGESVGGGAILNSTTGIVTVVDCEFIGNTSAGNVGGIAVGTSAGTVGVTNCLFISNAVNNAGGSEYFGDGGGLMVYSDGASHASICNNRFTNNSARGGSNPDGGGLMTYQSGAGSSLFLEGNMFTGNSAGLGGGGAILRFNESCVAEVRANEFAGNSTLVGSGGGILVYINQGSLLFAGNRHTGNSSAEDGGGASIYVFEGEARIESNVFAFNQATNNGGGILAGGDGALVSVSNNVFRSNAAGNVGGGVSAASGNGTVSVHNNTCYDNTALGDGGGLYIYLDATSAVANLKNNIITHSAPNSLAYAFGAGEGSMIMTYSAVGQGYGEPWYGEGCATNDPGFRNPDAGDFRLTWPGYPADDGTRSPCIDTGDPTSPLDPDGTRADMGALRFPQGLAAHGTPNWWLDAYNLTADGLSFDAAELTDTDGDGLGAWEEFIADTDPTNGASVFRIENILVGATATVLFASSSNRLYTLTASGELAGGSWTSVPGAGPRIGAGGMDVLSDTNEPTCGRFYRLRVRVP